jgi:hypothetical protein
MESKEGKEGWLVLLGAMLTGKEVRKQVLAAFTRQDVPKAIQPLWEAITSGDGKKVRDAVESLQWLPRGGSGKIIDSLIAKLQGDALKDFLETKCRQADLLSKGRLGADAVADTLEQWATEIRQRQAQIDKDKPAGTQNGDQ